jgi:hypothetical protein
MFGEELMVENTDQAMPKHVNQPKWKWSITPWLYIYSEKVPMNG